MAIVADRGPGVHAEEVRQNVKQDNGADEN
jgi:hypothetical protein